MLEARLRDIYLILRRICNATYYNKEKRVMKKRKIAGALIPALLFGSPMFASSRNFSRSSRKKIKSVSVKQEVTTDKVTQKSDPFGVFGASKHVASKSKEVHSDVLAFLKEEGLLQSQSARQNRVSGEIERKNFAGACVPGASFPTGDPLTQTIITGGGRVYDYKTPFSYFTYASAGVPAAADLIARCNPPAGPVNVPFSFSALLALFGSLGFIGFFGNLFRKRAS